jgi:hypothetical protein
MAGNKMQLIQFNNYCLIFSDEKSCLMPLFTTLDFKYSEDLLNDLNNAQPLPKITVPHIAFLLYQLTVEGLPNVIEKIEEEALTINSLSFNLSMNDRYIIIT